jgi:hypothetical protein
LGTFWLKIEQFWPFEEISIFSYGGHLEYRKALTDTILKGTHPGTIPARFGLIWFSGFRKFHILIFSSEITGPIATKLYWNGPWMAPFQKRLPTKMVTKLKIEKRGMKFELYIAALVSVKMRSYFNCSYMVSEEKI